MASVYLQNVLIESPEVAKGKLEIYLFLNWFIFTLKLI